MDLAPDFFSYFEALAPLLDRDPTLMCISSWNDHGQVRRQLFTSSHVLSRQKRQGKRCEGEGCLTITLRCSEGCT